MLLRRLIRFSPINRTPYQDNSKSRLQNQKLWIDFTKHNNDIDSIHIKRFA